MADTSDEKDMFPRWNGSEERARFTLAGNALFEIRGSVWLREDSLRPIRMTRLVSNVPVPKAFRIDKIEYSVATQVIVRWKDEVEVPEQAGAFELCRTPIEAVDPQMSLMQLTSEECEELVSENGDIDRCDCLKKKIVELRLSNEGKDIDWLELNSIPLPQHSSWPDDPAFENQWGLQVIRAYDAWQTFRRGEQLRPIVAIIDSGIDGTHLDLKDNLPDFDVERLRFMAAAEGLCNAEEADPQPDNSDEEHSHGTFCAGVVGAVTNNALGVAGVALRPVILPLKCIGKDGTGTVWDAMEAIDQAVRSGANVLLTAWGMHQPSRCLYAAFKYARDNNVLIVTAAGNNTDDIDLLPFYPASFKLDQKVPYWPLWLNCRDAAQAKKEADTPTDSDDEVKSHQILHGLDNILVAGGTVGWGFDSDGLQSEYDPREDKAESSNWGRETVDLGAPARYVRTTRRNHDWEPGGARLGWANGTSMAASFVAGAAALVKARFPRLTAQEIRRRLIKTAEYVDSLEEYWPYGRRLDLYMAMVAQEDAYGNFVDPKADKEESQPKRRRPLFGVLDQPHRHHGTGGGRHTRSGGGSHGSGSDHDGVGSSDDEACTVRVEPDHGPEITLKIQVETGRGDDSDHH